MEWTAGPDPDFGSLEVWSEDGEPVPVTAANLSGMVMLGYVPLRPIKPDPHHIPAALPRLPVYVRVQDPIHPEKAYCKLFRVNRDGSGDGGPG